MTTLGALNTETNTVGLKGTDNISAQDKAEVMSASSQISSVSPDATSQVMYRVIFSQRPKAPLNGGYCVVRQGRTTGAIWATQPPKCLILKDAGDSYGTFNCPVPETGGGDRTCDDL